MSIHPPIVLVGSDGTLDFFRDAERLRSYVEPYDLPLHAYDAAGRLIDVCVGERPRWWELRSWNIELIETSTIDPQRVLQVLRQHGESRAEQGLPTPAAETGQALPAAFNSWIALVGYCGER